MKRRPTRSSYRKVTHAIPIPFDREASEGKHSKGKQPKKVQPKKKKKAMQKFTIETPDGLGEAIKTERNVPWDVTLPTTEFRFYGSVPEVKAEIKRRLKVQYPTTNR